MSARDTILREIGLTPIWLARSQPPQLIEIESAELQAREAANIAQHAAELRDSGESRESREAREARIANLPWSQIDADIAECQACQLCKTRTLTVPGVGVAAPEWMVIGEAPGENEDKQGEPFVGRAGKLLDQMLDAVGKSRTRNVFIANVVKCRPPGNRDPLPEEIDACAPYLARQISLAQPKLLLAVGKFAGQQLLNTDATVGAMRAKPGRRDNIPVVVTYHPSYLLRSPLEKAKAWEDLNLARSLAAQSA